MPSFDVAVTLKTPYHRNPDHRWTTNDVHDIDAMGSALPYCDIVVTDKAMASHIQRTGLSERLQTVALARLPELDSTSSGGWSDPTSTEPGRTRSHSSEQV